MGFEGNGAICPGIPLGVPCGMQQTVHSVLMQRFSSDTDTPQTNTYCGVKLCPEGQYPFLSLCYVPSAQQVLLGVGFFCFLLKHPLKNAPMASSEWHLTIS